LVIGVAKEIKEGENRVALSPAGARQLVLDGHKVLVDKKAGEGSGISSEEYEEAGAELVPSAEEIYGRAEMVVKVKEPLPAEYPLLQEGQILFTYLHLAASESLTKELLKRKVTGIGYETIQTEDGRLPLLVPMSEIAGRMAVQAGATYLEASRGGRGVLLGGVPGVPPAEVVILGCGVAGRNSTKIAQGMGAHVTVVDIDHEKLRYIDDIMHGNVITVYSTPINVERSALYADLLIGTVLMPGARAPVLVKEEVVAKMKPGAVIVDIAVDQGGCIETVQPTSHAQPTFIKHGVVHYAVPNMPAAVPRTSTFALTNATIPYARELAGKGLGKAVRENPSLARGVQTLAGKVVHPSVASSFGMEYAPLESVL
jgi:alanine dehydrogenase